MGSDRKCVVQQNEEFQPEYYTVNGHRERKRCHAHAASLWRFVNLAALNATNSQRTDFDATNGGATMEMSNKGYKTNDAPENALKKCSRNAHLQCENEHTCTMGTANQDDHNHNNPSFESHQWEQC